MTDKANNLSRAEQAAESAAKNGSGSGETSALQDFVAGLLPKGGSNNGQSSESASDGARSTIQKDGSASGSATDNGKQHQIPREGKDNGDIINGKIGDKVGIGDNMKKHLNDLQVVSPDEKGVIKLQTGDTLVRAGGVEVLVTKGGGSVMVKPDGSYEVTGGTVKHDAKTGETTVDFGNGRSATIKDGRISSVTDGNNTAWMVGKLNRLDDGIRPLPHPYPGEWDKLKPNSLEELQNMQNKVPKRLEK